MNKSYHFFTFTALLMLIFGLSLLGCQSLEDTQQPDNNDQHDGSLNDPVAEESDATNDQNTNEIENEPSESEFTEDEEVEVDELDEVEVEEVVVPYQVNTQHYRIKAVDENGQDKIALLTIDDTPAGHETERILDILDQYSAKAIFFVNGHYAERYPELLMEIYNRGHEIGNHTWWHIFIRQEDEQTVRQEIVGLNDFLEELTGEKPRYFRPPYGQNSDVSLDIIREEGMQTMNWSNGSLDWEFNEVQPIIDQVLDNMHNGANILFHDKKVTADALGPILEELVEQGYEFVLPTEVIPPE